MPSSSCATVTRTPDVVLKEHCRAPPAVRVKCRPRPWLKGWITGFVDGEGCFSINFVRQPDRPGRRGYAVGYQVAHEFAVVQGASSVSSLQTLQMYFGCGDITLNRRHDNHKEDLNRFAVRRRESISKIIIPFFERNPLLTAKQANFLKFRKCMELINRGAHLSVSGFSEIVHVAQTMNHCRPRDHILRDLSTRVTG